MDKEIITPFKEKKLFHQVLRYEGGARGANPGLYSRIIPYNNNWILLEPSSDTIYTLMPDFSLRPFIAKTPANFRSLLFHGKRKECVRL